MPLTNEQKDILKKIIGNLDNQQVQTLGGYAGTGKSTIITVLLEALSRRGMNFCAAAFTGKATNVLRKKGMNANTIHGTIYEPYKDKDNETVWRLAERSTLATKGIDGFIIDEASMVSKEIDTDLASFGLPIIYVGDHGQLEPIGTKFNIMQNPMYKLETVHRNAGEIAHFAEHLRKGNPSTTFKGATKVQIVRESAVEDRHLANVDQIICAFNKTRVILNEKVRVYKKINYTYIAIGEKVICLRNNKKQGLFNGMQGIVKKVHKNDRFDFVSDNNFYEKVHYDPDQFGKDTNQFEFSQSANPFDYAYAITAHKSQGDEFGSVVAYEQRCDKWDHVRWSYTVASRAKTSLIWIAYETYLPKYL
jgi:exodeoxyribonuclease-5